LFGTTYGLGVQSNTLYNRSNNYFSWFRQGTHSDDTGNPGTVGSTVGRHNMFLDNNGDLYIRGNIFVNVDTVNNNILDIRGNSFLNKSNGTINSFKHRYINKENNNLLCEKFTDYSVGTNNGSFTVILPASPGNYDEIRFSDITGTWNIENFIINNNNKMIMGLSENLICDKRGASIRLIYFNDNWRILI
jgi:hypothetical protein